MTTEWQPAIFSQKLFANFPFTSSNNSNNPFKFAWLFGSIKDIFLGKLYMKKKTFLRKLYMNLKV